MGFQASSTWRVRDFRSLDLPSLGNKIRAPLFLDGGDELDLTLHDQTTVESGSVKDRIVLSVGQHLHRLAKNRGGP